MKKGMKNFVALVLAFAMVCTSVVVNNAGASAAKKPKLSATKVSINKGKSKTITIKNAKSKDIKSVKWTTSKKSVATVKKSSKTKAKIKAVKKGTATIKCVTKIKKKKYTFKVKVTVKNAPASTTEAGTSTPTPVPSSATTVTPAPATGNATPTPAVAEANKPEAAIEKAIYSENFDDGVGKFQTRTTEDGQVKISQATDCGFGNTALYVTDRMDGEGEYKSWMGTQVSLKECGAEYGKDYKITAWVMSRDTIRDPSQPLNDKKRGVVLSKIAVGADGTESDDYNAANQAESGWISDNFGPSTGGCKRGTWVKLSATVTMPSEGDLRIYFETPAVSKVSFYIDSFSVSEVTGKVDTSTLPSLADAYAGVLDLGTALGSEQMRNSVVMADVLRQFKTADAETKLVTGGSITMGNEFKPSSILGGEAELVEASTVKDLPASYQDTLVPVLHFANVDETLKLAKEYGFKMRGHCLVWHQQTSDWFFREDFKEDGAFVTKKVMKGRMEWYIKSVLTHIQNAEGGEMVYCWDVVNEVFSETGTMRNPANASDHATAANMDSRWVAVYGDDSFVQDAFTFARTYANDDIDLYYNDYNEYNPAKRDAIVKMANKLKEIQVHGKPIITGIGMQSHLGIGSGGELNADCSLKNIGAAIDAFASTGLKIQATELDITKGAATSDQFAQVYKDLFNLYIEKKEGGANLDKIILWGISDESSWRKEQYPTVFRAGFQPKKVFWELINLGRTKNKLDPIKYTENDYYGDKEVIG